MSGSLFPEVARSLLVDPPFDQSAPATPEKYQCKHDAQPARSNPDRSARVVGFLLGHCGHVALRSSDAAKMKEAAAPDPANGPRQLVWRPGGETSAAPPPAYWSLGPPRGICRIAPNICSVLPSASRQAPSPARNGYTMVRYTFSGRYAATVLPIIREIHLEILARNQRGPQQVGGAVSNRAVEREIARALAARGVATMHGGSWTAAQVKALLDRRPPS
jgi:hypothetical protein